MAENKQQFVRKQLTTGWTHFVFNSFTVYKYELSFFLLSEFDAETRTSWCVEVHLVKL